MALLGLLDREPSHGYDLKRDYDAYFGRGRPLPYGQVYATLARLARDGKAVAGEAEPGAGPDRKRYTITETGKYEVETWLGEPIPAEPYLQTDLFVKVVLSLMLGRPAEEYLDTQRAAHLAGCASSPSSNGGAASSMRSSLTMGSSTWRPTCAGSTSPRRGSRRSPRRWRRERHEQFPRGPVRQRDHRGTRPRALLRGDARASRRRSVRATRRGPRRDGPEWFGQVDPAPLPGGHPRPGLR